MRRLTLGLALALVVTGARAEEKDPKPPDVFSQALSEMGITAKDLGYRPKAHWARYPHPNRVPHVLPFFTDLHANPLDTYEFTRTLGNAVEDLLTPEALREKENALERLGVLLATDRRIGGFRGYGTNLDPRPEKKEPLRHALVRLLDRSGTRFARDFSFGKPADNAEDPHADLVKQVAGVPEPLRLPLAKLVLNLIDARVWIDRGLRRVPQKLRDAVFETLPDLAWSTGDATQYFPQIDDVARLIDEHSLHYGCLKALRAVQDARREIGAVEAPEGGWPEFELRVETEWGEVVLASPGAQVLVRDPLLVVLFAPQTVLGALGATEP
ncbi:MAG: hypothetical protein ACYS99_11400, partial [Planctomycetota bacterium]